MNDPWCTAESPCHLDAAPYLTHPSNSAWHWQLRCGKCDAVWLDYKTPRLKLAEREARRSRA